jgi:ABC-2 type transport system permease protein
MNKILLIIKREYLTRVRKRSFLIMTLIGPLLMASVFIIPVYLTQIEGEIKLVGILDDTGLFTDQISNTENIHFIYLSGNIDSLKTNISKSELYALLHIPATELSVPQTAKLYAFKQPNIMVTGHIKNEMRKVVETNKLKASGIDPDILRSIKSGINLLTIRIDDQGSEKNSSAELSMTIGIVAGILIYIFIFTYGALVMRGVIEEKTNRIVEVIISSVKPFELMMGKVVGVAMVGLTQFTLWVLLTLIIVTGVLSVYADEFYQYRSSPLDVTENNLTVPGGEAGAGSQGMMDESLMVLFGSLEAFDFAAMILLFLFYFIGGYLLYGALFAAIGSAVDNETDTQQFMIPLTIPLIISIFVAQFVMLNPEGPAAFWLSIFPLTSPVIMMVRVPFGIPPQDIAISMALLVAGFVGAVWLAARIYRTGILMYGKKISYTELWKWIRYKG